ncbi:hypothetical protein D9M69_571490 [compost metagenome]
MARRDVALHRHGALGGQRVVLAHEAHQVVFEQQRQVQPVGRLRPVADDDVKLTLGQRALVVVGDAQRVHHQPRMRRLGAEPRGHVGQEAHRQVVGQREVEGHCARGGLELLRAREHAVDLEQRAARAVAQLQRPLGRHHAAALAHEDGVGKHLAQPAQGGADGGLGLVHAHCHAGDAAFGHQGDQHAQQVGVDRGVGA